MSSELYSGPGSNNDQTGTEPVTDHQSKRVMLRAERKDTVTLSHIEQRLVSDISLPTSFEVLNRNQTYYGPNLLLTDDSTRYKLTAPGPDAQLLLWQEETDCDGYRIRWRKVGFVTVEFDGELPQYSICQYCGEPIKNAEHERLSLVGACQ